MIDRRSRDCVRIKVWNEDGDPFFVYFYGLTEKDLCEIPNQYVSAMIRRRHFERCTSSLFTVEQVR